MFGRILRTLFPIVMIASDIKTSLVFGIILIICFAHFTLIQIDLPQKEVPKILIIHLPNGRITRNIIDEDESC